MGTVEISPSKTHILAFPLPAKGHINPMLHLCNRLASKGFRVTLITTISTYKDFKDKDKAKGGLIDIELIPYGKENLSSKQVSMNVKFKMFRDSVTETMPGIIEKYKLLGPDFSPKVLIYDSTMPWMLEVAQGHGVLGASFFTQPICVCAVYHHMLQGTVAAVPPVGDESSRVFLLPCLPPLEIKDLPGLEYFKEDSGFISKMLLDQFLNIDKVDYIFFNTFDKLEAEVANWMTSKWKILTVGPVAPTTATITTTSSVLLEEEEKKKNKKYLFETNTEVCMKWLDEGEPNSVIYVSFGSAATSTEEQMEEIAEGLLMSNFNFLWVVRDEERSKLPNDHPIMNNNSSVTTTITNITTNTGKSGLIINWCPQLDVLSHGSVACFMTHCGWNSTLEAISSGVPMIAVPQWVDQTTNAKFIQDVWKIGVRVTVDGDGCGDRKDNSNINGLVRREEIVRCVREVCESEKGKELKRNAMKWKDLAKEAVSEGGSSHRNLEEFASSLLLY